MSAPIKFGAQAVLKKIPAASRAVSASEIRKIAPDTVSQTTSSMPWSSWFSSFLKSVLPHEKYERLRHLVLYRPDDIHDLSQVPNPSTKVPIDGEGNTAMFRYPSPGSQGPVRMPTVEKGTIYEDPYFVAHYPRDIVNRDLNPDFPNPKLERLKLALLPQDDEQVQEALEALDRGPPSSPGNKGVFATGKTDYDTTGGLRATMSTNYAAANKVLEAYMPDHLPVPVWWDKQDEIVAWYEERNLPVPMGATGFGLTPTSGRTARW